MRLARFAVVAMSCVGCTHDFDAFAAGAPEDALATDSAITDTMGTDTTPVVDSGGVDTTISDTGTVDTTPPPVDTGTGSDGGVTCTEPGAKTFGGHCYFQLSSNRTWDAARTDCAAAGAHLVAITSAAEETFVESFSPTADRWIGLSRPSGSPVADASFKWVTGEAFTYKDWAPSEPNGTGLCIRIRGGGQWGDQTCTNSYVSICERE